MELEGTFQGHPPPINHFKYQTRNKAEKSHILQ